jgi:hypothetical protein
LRARARARETQTCQALRRAAAAAAAALFAAAGSMEEEEKEEEVGGGVDEACRLLFSDKETDLKEKKNASGLSHPLETPIKDHIRWRPQ